jgi:hypothetical protein
MRLLIETPPLAAFSAAAWTKAPSLRTVSELRRMQTKMLINHLSHSLKRFTAVGRLVRKYSNRSSSHCAASPLVARVPVPIRDVASTQRESAAAMAMAGAPLTFISRMVAQPSSQVLISKY